MYEIRATVNFDAAHFLRNYIGPCAKMHGHSWKVEAAVTGSELGQSELLMDFHDLRMMLQEITEEFDHGCLNDLEPFRELSPTSENIAAFVFNQLCKSLEASSHEVNLVWVSVAESPDTKVVYRGED
jgi:6-pyruvoyltetrahydropterin/6-carboxytetrahydropterin synthase